ncbi:hypothetical protein J7L01_01670 [bacterium]|nr:hypothetical protein [bacterium]
MTLSIAIAIWAIVALFALVAIFAARFLSQLTKVGVEGESTLKTLNSRLPSLIDRGEDVLSKAEATIARVNNTMDEIAVPLQYARMLTNVLPDPKRLANSKFGDGAATIVAGIKAGRIIVESLRKHLLRKKHGDAPREGE